MNLHPSLTSAFADESLTSASASASSLLLLKKLEASLEATQTCLLTRDVAGLERATSEQCQLLQLFSLAWGRQKAAGHFDNSVPSPVSSVEPSGIARRVLDLARVQLVLLARSQQWLRAVANMLSGSSTAYGPPNFEDQPSCRV